MAIDKLYAFAHLGDIGFVPAGVLTLTQGPRDVEASTFIYGTRYLERPGRIEIDPVSLALDGPVQGVELQPANQLRQFGGIRDAAPDAWGRRVIESRLKAPANSLPESRYLLEAGSERVGALDMRRQLDSPADDGVAPVRDLQYMLEAAECVEAGEDVPAGLRDYLGSGATAGGARPKSTVRDADGLLHLAKFPSRSDTFDVATVECATLKLAGLCGLTVPAAQVRDIGGRNALLIRRFDRHWVGADPTAATTALHETLPGPGLQERRLPFVSGLTMVGCDEYDSPTKGYVDLAHAVRQHAAAGCIRADTAELFGRMVFNIFVSNDDDHLRNHGFVRDPRVGGWRLSPLYDVVPRPSHAFERTLHLEVGSHGKQATLDNAMSAHAGFIPERPDAVAVIRRVWGVMREWKSHFEAFGVPARLVDTMAPAMRNLQDIALEPRLVKEIRQSS